MPSVDLLFEPFIHGNLTLPNRIVMAPMTRSKSPMGIPGEDVAAYYRRRAEGGVGLIITEGTGVDHAASLASESIPRFHGTGLAGWKHVVDQVHSAGGKIMPQLWHMGAAGGQNDMRPNVGPTPSGVDLQGNPVGAAATENEIADLISAFARSAEHALELGFDGVEIHGAHGYLIDQFFWEHTNHRDDRWGGSIAARALFGAEITKAIRSAVGPDFPILFRFSQWKMNNYEARLVNSPDQLEQFLAPLNEAGVDVFHCSQRRYWEPEFEGSSLNLAGWTKKLTGKPTITVGSVGLTSEFTDWDNTDPLAFAGIDGLLDRLADDEFDLVAIGRMLIADPNWPVKLRSGQTDTILPFSRDRLAKLD